MRGWKPWNGARWMTKSPYLSSGLHCPLNQISPGFRQAHDASCTIPTLKGELRRLYKLVHPDLLHNRPDQQAVNQKSFQLLQEYLSAAKGVDRSRRNVYHFQFYIRRNPNDDSLEKVEVSLPPPHSRARYQQNEEILPATRRALGQLFAACGLSEQISGSLSGKQERICIPALFQEASERQRQNEASRLNMQHQLNFISNALLLGRGVKVLFRTAVEEVPTSTQIELLEKLVQAVDRVTGIDLGGSTIVFGNSCTVDALGNLWLNAAGTVEVWVQFLCKADQVTASSRKAFAKQRCMAEERAARLMGVNLFFAESGLASHPHYMSFLNCVGDGALQRGAVGGGRFTELAIRVALVEACMVDEIGIVTAPLSEEFLSLYSFIEQQGEEALKRRRSLKLVEKKLEDLKLHVRKKLRLRYLTFDEKLSSDQLMSACTRLSSHASKLANYTEGLSLCISDEYRLPTDGSGYFVHMKWNFSPDDL